MNKIPTHLSCPECGTDVRVYRNPLPTSDVIIRFNSGIVLIKRKNPPHGWAIPGGFIEYGETAENAAKRETNEETGLDLENLKLYKVCSEPGRDPRFHTLSVLYTADGTGSLVAGDDASEARIFNKSNLPEQIAFDHREILEDYFQENPHH
jgi:ADP-ribose pyrophosphatase YjhB (NUDIX family)